MEDLQRQDHGATRI